jgi:hypothetical protein
MGQIEIFPAVQVASSGTVVATGAASSLIALNDSSDSSYIVNSGSSRASRGYMLDDFSGSLPAGAVVQSVQMRFRYSHANRPNPSPYEILKPVTVLIGRQVPIGGGAFKYVYDGYHGGQQMLDWVASTSITEATFHPRQQTYAGEYYADIYARGGRRLFVSLELLADTILNVSRMYSISVLVNYNELPVVAVVDPTGTYSVSRPTITWTYSDPDGDSQTLFHVKIFTDDQVAAAGFNVDTSEALYDVSRWSSVTQHTPESSFYVGDGVYRAYVRVAHNNIGNQQMWSAWDFNDFTLDLEEPQYPVILAEHDASMNAVMIEFQSHDNMLDWNQSSGELTTTAGVTGDTNTTVTNTSAQASHGVRSFQYTRTGSTGTAAFRTTAGLGGIAVHEGDLYIVLVDVRTQTTARSVSVGISWYDAAGALLSTSTGVASNDASGAWQQRYVIAKAPVGAMTAAVVVSAASVAVSENHYADKLSILRVHHHVYPQENAADLALWQAGTNTTLAISTAQRYDGDASMSMTRTTSTGTASGHTFPGLFGIPAVAGEIYEATAQFRASTTGRVCSIVFRFYDISQVILSATQTQVSPTDLTTGWVEASVSATAPANTVWVEIDVAAAGCAVSEVHYVDRITLTHFASRTWTRGGFLNETSVMVRERSIDLGTTWQAYRDSISMDGHIEHIDGEIPSAAEVWYRAKVEADNQDGEPMTSVYSPVERIIVPVYTAWWLRDPLDMPDSNMIVRVKSSVAERPKPQSVGYPLEGSTAVVSHDGVKGRVWSLEIDLLNEGDYATFWQMIESGHTLVIQDTLGRQVYVQPGETTREEMMRAYKTPFEQWPIRHAHTVELTFIEVERASG